ncbi:Heparinase II/III-like protein [Histomonas meleagridis]|uniref:Heparinase II/III-like protein n=1 Tax=Histomonas meleagridis TaxID=135588 RepID=UPI003559D842|nr:Heparinase II/III-like protein [Histomonas meleagridis]KAH0806780.1 Heparinase II/III-like protein [Histomonas meleagridis]
MRNYNETVINNLIPRTTPGTTTFCPNCVKTGRLWHANGDWSWNRNNPDQITCNVCGMQFPNSQYPEDLVYQSSWDPQQKFSYVGSVGPVTCMSYTNCRSSPSAVIRAKKLQHLISGPLYNVALGYLLSNDTAHAQYVKNILLKLSNVMPKYLVYEGYSYNEYADCNPRVAAKNISNLPSSCRKITSSGYDTEDKEMYSAYWSASRLGSSGMDGSIVGNIALSFDFTINSGVYTEEEINKIKIDLIEEAAYLGYCDDLINNKAVSNRQGVALAGLAIDFANLTRFGLNGFIRTINEWFLEDGSTSESAAYGLMTINGILRFGYAFRDYSDPDDYVPLEGETKYTHFNVNTDTYYDQVWQNMIWTLQSNMYYPVIADSYVDSKLSTTHLDFISFTYPSEENNKVISELTNPNNVPSTENLFYRDPSLNITSTNNNTELYKLPDIVFPYISQGFIRTGEYGRNSTIVLDASNYGNHHHYDSLNIIYWKDGHELLNDLGYLWDHVNKSQTVQTFAHNTVVIDGNNQITKERNGSFHIFSYGDNVKIMQASSNAYKEANIYQRTVTQIEHENKSYLVDIFRVESGDKKRQYIFHGVNQNYTLKSDLKFTEPEEQIEVRFGFKLNLGSLGYIDVSDVSLREEYLNGTLGPEYATAFPNTVDNKCPENGTWCYYVGNGKCKWESIPGYKTRGVKFTATEASNNVVNVGLYVGNTNGYIAPNSFIGKIGSRYKVSFYMRGNVFPNTYCQYWSPGNENNSSGRVYSKFNYETSTKISSEWTLYKGYFDIGTRISDKLSGTTLNPWEVKWNINENYSFSAYVPSRKSPEKVFYNDGWGQRFYNNSDYGTTLPYFYIHRATNEISSFVVVYEGYENGKNIIENVEVEDDNNGNVGIKIKTKDGDDYVLSSFNNSLLNVFGRETDASIAVELYNKEIVISNGTKYKNDKPKFETNKCQWNGYTESYNNDDENSWFVISGVNPLDVNAQTLFITYDDGIERAYPIFDVEKSGGKIKVYTRRNRNGFRIHRNGNWRISNFEVIDGSKLSTGEIAAIVVAACVVLVLIVFGIAVFVKKRGEKDNLD